ncbi:MAG: hypothetical protein ACO1O1_10860 [Adhaeribacter sp.]
MITRISCFLLLLLCASACCREKDLHLSPAMAAWLPYTQGQQLTFTGPNGKKLEFTATLASFNQQGSDKACGAFAIETRQVQLRPMQDPDFVVQATLSHEVLVGLRVFRGNPPGGSLEILYNTVSEYLVSDPWRDRLLQELPLNGKTYHKVLYAYGSSGAGDLSFAEMYYARDKGLVGFKLFSGEQYFLD